MISFAVYLFAGVAVLMVILALAWIGPRLFSAPGVRAGVDRETTNLEVYRDELAQLAVDYQCGRISAEALEDARTELNRRLLDDTSEGDANKDRMRMPARSVGIVVMLLVPLAAAGLYLNIGSADALKIVSNDEINFYQQLQERLRSHPNDARAWVILGRYEMERNRFREAEKAFESGIEASPKVANDANVLCDLAEAIGMAQGGTFEGRPRELVEKALTLAPDNARVLEMAGGAAYEARDYASAIGYWKALLAQIPEDSQAYRQLDAAITYIETEARVAQSAAEMTSANAALGNQTP
ncbi:MAG: c-type cytochrome biogenesis protein CcmI [Burkholderiales bacterium]|jgi:cytochrome c-type biogenesis protein CcmH|nr:c-type cytochrome biogenesis protein CcmI [Burkholderiales bacterium]